MRRPRSVAAAVSALVVAALIMSSCTTGKSPSTTSSGTGGSLPTTTSVHKARFVSTIVLDGGQLTVTAPPTRSRPTVSQSDANAIFEAADIVAGTHTFALFGLGTVTISPGVASTTTSTTAPTSTAPTSTAPTTTTAPAAGTVSTTTSSTAAPGPSTTTPRVDGLLAWVGIVWGGVVSCPATSTTRARTATVSTYEVVIVDAHSDQDVVAYSSGGPPTCGGASASPTVSVPDELVSIPWQPVGASSTAITVTVPPCGQYYGWTEPATSTGVISVQVVADVADNAPCASTAATSQTIESVVPLGQGAQIGHAPLGLIDGVDDLSPS